MINDSGQTDRMLLDRLDRPVKWYIKDRLRNVRTLLKFICPLFLIYASVCVGDKNGYQRALNTNHVATASEKERIIKEYWYELSRGESLRSDVE